MAAAPSPSEGGGGGGLHFDFPEGTTSITQPARWEKEVHDSWAEFGVDKTTVTSVGIPTSVASIGVNAFKGCILLLRVAIPSSVTSIAEAAFYGCSSLTSADIPSSVTSIAQLAFDGCSSLASVAIPASVTSIEAYAFANCSSLANVAIPSSVTMIEAHAFYNCNALASVAIPTSVTSIEANAFRGCSSLMGVDIPTSVTNIEVGTFYGCDSLASVSIPSSVTRIGWSAFRGCSSLASVAIPSSVTRIEQGAFANCSSLASVEISASVNSIEWRAFNGCNSLTMVLVSPGGADAAVGAADSSNSNAWSRLFDSFIGMVPNEDYEGSDDEEIVEGECDQLLPDEARIWAPDHIVAQLTGRFNECKLFADIPRALRAAPNAKTWAGVQLWLWWLPPTSFGDGDRVVCRARVVTVWATMLGGFRAEKTASLPRLPEELWLYMFRFLKHDQQPTVANGL